MVKISIENVEQYLEEIFDEDSYDSMDCLENIENSYSLNNIQEQMKNVFLGVVTLLLIVEGMTVEIAASCFHM